jgi:small redox-active disulfide protein 2
MPFYNSNYEEDLKIKVKGEYEMKIEILGMGCTNCNKLYENALEAVKLSGKEVQVTKVEDIQKIMSYGVMSTPALVVDGVVKVAGKLLKVEEIKKLIQ